MAEELTFPAASAALLEPHLPVALTASESTAKTRPFVTLTFATSLDSTLALAPGVRTRLSGPGSKAMTHYLRSRHSAILIGVSTLLADDPGLNCRIAGVTSQPRPIVIDPHLRWTPKHTDKVLETCRNGSGLAPYVITGVGAADHPPESVALLNEHGGKFIHITAIQSGPDGRMRFDWCDVFAALQEEGLSSVMVEGGGKIINSLLSPAYHELVDSVIVTIAPTWLGTGGVVVSPDRAQDGQGMPIPVARLSDISWHPFGEDVVLCGKLRVLAAVSYFDLGRYYCPPRLASSPAKDPMKMRTASRACAIALGILVALMIILPFVYRFPWMLFLSNNIRTWACSTSIWYIRIKRP